MNALLPDEKNLIEDTSREREHAQPKRMICELVLPQRFRGCGV